jgi:type II secretory ATPase GspE/PulE/Tfp pilus assembly ATPase PilB-like protein
MSKFRTTVGQCLEKAGGRGAFVQECPPTDSLIDLCWEQGELDEEVFGEELARALGLEYLPHPQPDAEKIRELRLMLPASLALRYRLLPVAFDETGEKLLLASCNPLDLLARQEVAREVKKPVRWSMAPRKRLIAALADFYGIGADTLEKMAADRDIDLTLESRDEANVLDEGDDEEATVVRFVNQILREALRQGATDIHFEPLADTLRMRYRIDGKLQEIPVPENIRALQQSVITRLKIMARLDIAERRLPQDGRIHLQIGGDSIDVRVATIPSLEGESVSLRLLGQQKFSIERLQMEPKLQESIQELLAKPNGIVLVTGPTGCGKSTTLYTFLSQLNTNERRVVTVEDPVENKLRGVVQIAVKQEIDLTFASALRSILRGDPNVIMVGEIRDLETAEIAIRAALTGHLVFSTLHTNDAIGGISRLIDMGVEPFLIASSVRAFIAQRLVRTLCESCKEPEPDPGAKIKLLDPQAPEAPIFRAKVGGCELCRRTGYRGRMAIYELCSINKAMGELISSKASGAALLKQAIADGFLPMRRYGLKKVLEGLTTVDEVLGETFGDD